MPLNKFLAHCGICSRRDAVSVITSGNVKVNGAVAMEPGYKVQPADEVIYNGKKLFVTKNLVYILLNKPKDYLTTTDDPQGRKTVLQLIQAATAERIYPIGRLDRNTSGVLLLTNDGDLTQKLSHPSYEITKLYEVKLDKPLIKADFDKIINGIVLEDGVVRVDSLAYADGKDRSVIGIEIHSGRNRIVRRIFESLGYDVKGLDRVMYAGLTKKNVERGKWRYLAEKEIRLLKYMNESKRKKKTESSEETEQIKQLTEPAAPAALVQKKKIESPGTTENPTQPRKFKAPTEKKLNKAERPQPDSASAPAVSKKPSVVAAAKEKTVQPRKFKTHAAKKLHEKERAEQLIKPAAPLNEKVPSGPAKEKIAKPRKFKTHAEKKLHEQRGKK